MILQNIAVFFPAVIQNPFFLEVLKSYAISRNKDRSIYLDRSSWLSSFFHEIWFGQNSNFFLEKFILSFCLLMIVGSDIRNRYIVAIQLHSTVCIYVSRLRDPCRRHICKSMPLLYVMVNYGDFQNCIIQRKMNFDLKWMIELE